MPTRSRSLTRQADKLGHRLGYPSSWVADQVAAQLVPDFRLPWPRQREAWGAIREVRTRSVPPDVTAVEVALHGKRGHYTLRLRPALIGLSGLDVDATEPAHGEHDESAEQAAAALMDGTGPAAGPNAEMVRLVLAANGARGPMNGAAGPIVPDDLHALATTMVGLEDIWRATHRRLGAIGSPEALRAVEAIAERADPSMTDAPSDPADWGRFVGELDGGFVGAPLARVYRTLVEQAPPDVLVDAVRMGAQFRPEWVGVEARGRRDRARMTAQATPLSLFLRAAVMAGRSRRSLPTATSPPLAPPEAST